MNQQHTPLSQTDPETSFFSAADRQDPEDIDILLAAADRLRQLIESRRYEEICIMIRSAVEEGLDEAFSWIMEILQEDLEKEDCGLESFSCSLGKAVPHFDRFTDRLQVDPWQMEHEVKNVYDRNGEQRSFYNICTFRTKYPNIRLVSSENFDTKDNDFILYELSFLKSPIL